MQSRSYKALGPELERVQAMVIEYVEMLREELQHRWTKWATTLMESEKYECVGGLLARQVTLATQLARCPSIWNGHIAPIILRTMVDTFITLSWILRDPLPRSRQFIHYGLGQTKLYTEHLKASLSARGEDPTEIVNAFEEWINSQRFMFLTEVNLGAWTEMSVRKMAEETGQLELYNLAYAPFSAATHSMWHHVARYNLAPCDSPLHRYHRLPVDPDLDSDPDYLYRAAKYAQESFDAFDTAVSITSDVPSAFHRLMARLAEFGFEDHTPTEEQDEGGPSDTTPER